MQPTPNEETLSALSQPGKQPEMSKLIISTKMPDAMTPKAVEKAAAADPDAQPLTETDLKRMNRTAQVKTMRRALALTQEQFSIRYHIALSTLRDWEQGRGEPDKPAAAYLKAIARDPEHVNRTLSVHD